MPWPVVSVSRLLVTQIAGGVGDYGGDEAGYLARDGADHVLLVLGDGESLIHPEEQAPGAADNRRIGEISLLGIGRKPGVEVLIALHLRHVDISLLAVGNGQVRVGLGLRRHHPQRSAELRRTVVDRICVGHQHVAVRRRLRGKVVLSRARRVQARVRIVHNRYRMIGIAGLDLRVSRPAARWAGWPSRLGFV